MPILESKSYIDGQEMKIYIEVDEAYDSEDPYRDQRGAVNKVIGAARDTFGEAMELARHCAARVVSSVKTMEENIRPDEFQVQLAIKLDSEMGAVLAKMSAGAQMQISIKWSNKS